jgi:branched-chain amino acid transport system permease protein
MARRRILELAWAPIVIVVGLGILTLVVSQLGEQETLTAMLINVVLVVGLWIFVGNSGVLSFGHISFMAVGAYVASILTIPVTTREFLLPELPGVLSTADPGEALALVIAMAATAFFALLVGIALMRLSGVAAGIATLSLLVIVTNVLQSWDALTSGGGTLTGIALTADVTTAYLTAAAAILVAVVFQWSGTGRRLRATREDIVAARALGIRPVRVRLAAFVLSAAVMAAGGWLYAHYLGSISAESFSFQATFLVIAMLVVGGSNSLAGAVLGVVAITALREAMQHLEEAGALGAGWSTVAVAAAVIAILIWRPQGLTQGREPRLPTRWFGDPAAVAESGVPEAPAADSGTSTPIEASK